jgi:hypothetical protein
MKRARSDEAATSDALLEERKSSNNEAPAAATSTASIKLAVRENPLLTHARCDICMLLLDQRIVLPCSHASCRDCVSEFSRKSGMQTACPICRVDHKLAQLPAIDRAFRNMLAHAIEQDDDSALLAEWQAREVLHEPCGKRTLKDGSVYEGDLLLGKPHGKGKLVLSSGITHEGEFQDGLYHETGCHTKDKYIAKGTWIKGVLEGPVHITTPKFVWVGTAKSNVPVQGKSTLTTGNIFEGVWKDRYMVQGKVSYRGGKDGVYEGTLVRHKREGQGTMHFATGDTHTGEWKANAPCGQGTRTFADGRVLEGVWQGERIIQGKAKITFPDKRVYEGEVNADADHVPHGQGRMTHPDGGVYQGQYDSGVRSEQGTYTSPSGQAYQGEWLNDLEHGQGWLFYCDKSVLEGTFLHGAAEGSCKQTWPDGRTLVGMKHAGQWTGKCTEQTPDGAIFEGVYDKDLKEGLGKTTRSDGTIFETVYTAGQPAKEGILTLSNGDVFEGVCNKGRAAGLGVMRAGGLVFKGPFHEQ